MSLSIIFSYMGLTIISYMELTIPVVSPILSAPVEI